jgi:hypothetical protein
MKHVFMNLDDWLTVHRSITLVDLQLDAKNSYLFTYNTFKKFYTCFEHYPAQLQENYVVIIYMQPLVYTYIQLRRRPPRDEQVNARNM